MYDQAEGLHLFDQRFAGTRALPPAPGLRPGAAPFFGRAALPPTPSPGALVFGQPFHSAPPGAHPEARRPGRPQHPPRDAMRAAKEINRRLSRAQSLGQVADVLAAEMPSRHFNAVNTSTALHRLAKLAHDSGASGHLSAPESARVTALAGQLNAVAVSKIAELDAQGLSNLLWANATIKRVLGAEAMSGIALSAETSMGAGGRGTLQPPAAPAAPEAPEAPRPVAGDLPAAPEAPRPASASTAVFGDGDLAAPKGTPRDDEDRRSSARAAAPPAAPARAAARRSWDWGPDAGGPPGGAPCGAGPAASPPRPGHQLWGAVMRAVEAKLGSFQPQGIANVMWAVSTLDYRPAPEAVASLLQAASPLLPRFEPQHLSITTYACSLLRYHPGPRFLGALCRAASQSLPSFKPQELSNLLWGLSKLGHRDPELLDAAARLCEVRPGAFSRPQHAASVLYAFAALGWHPGRGVTSQLAGLLARHLPEAKLSEVAAGAYGAAVLELASALDLSAGFQRGGGLEAGEGPRELAAAAAREAGRAAAAGQLGLLRADEVAHLVWGLAMLDALSPALWARACEALHRPPAGAPSPAALRMLAETGLALEGRHPGALERLRPALLAPALGAWGEASDALLASVGDVRADVNEVLARAGGAPLGEVEVGASGVLRAAMGSGALGLALEAVPARELTGAPGQGMPSPHVLARCVALARHGLAPVLLRADRWAAAWNGGGRESQGELLASLLAAAAAGPAGGAAGPWGFGPGEEGGSPQPLGGPGAAPGVGGFGDGEAGASGPGGGGSPVAGSPVAGGTGPAAPSPLWANGSPWGQAWAMAGAGPAGSPGRIVPAGRDSDGEDVDTDGLASRVVGMVLDP